MAKYADYAFHRKLNALMADIARRATMDKSEAMKRLDAIESEAKELRRIIDGKIEYVDGKKIYIGTRGQRVYLLCGYSEAKYFRWHSFAGKYFTEQAYSEPSRTGQDAIDEALADGFDIRVFDNRKEAFQFFLDNCKED